jgi:hypothetical protein
MSSLKQIGVTIAKITGLALSGVFANIIGQVIVVQVTDAAFLVSKYSPLGAVLLMLMVLLYQYGDLIDALGEDLPTVIVTFIIAFAPLEVCIWLVVVLYIVGIFWAIILAFTDGISE